jgi:hypothetical protein
MIWTQQKKTDVFTRLMESLFQMFGVVNSLDKQVSEQWEHNDSSLRKTFQVVSFTTGQFVL